MQSVHACAQVNTQEPAREHHDQSHTHLCQVRAPLPPVSSSSPTGGSFLHSWSGGRDLNTAAESSELVHSSQHSQQHWLCPCPHATHGSSHGPQGIPAPFPGSPWIPLVQTLVPSLCAARSPAVQDQRLACARPSPFAHTTRLHMAVPHAQHPGMQPCWKCLPSCSQSGLSSLLGAS